MYQPDKLFPLPESLPAETVREPWRQVLLDAAEVLRSKGWCQEFFEDDCTGAHCVYGAVIVATGDSIARAGMKGMTSLQIEAAGQVADYVGSHSAMSWNDAPGRTKAEVIAALEGAARSALREGGK